MNLDKIDRIIGLGLMVAFLIAAVAMLIFVVDVSF